MKTITKFMIAIMAVITLMGCQSPNPSDETGLSLSTENITVADIGDEQVITLNSNAPWRASVSESGTEWLTVSPTTGPGGQNVAITITAKSLEEGESLEAKITFKLIDGSVTKVVNVTRGITEYNRKSDSLALVALYEAVQKGSKVKWTTALDMSTWEGVVLREVNGEQRVVELNLGQKDVKGKMTRTVGYLSELESLNLSQTVPISGVAQKGVLSGPIPATIVELKKLKKLDLSYNKLSDEIPAGIFDIPTLKTVELQGNQLTKAIPATVGNAVELTKLDLAMNKLTGPIPEVITKLTKIDTLRFSSNQLSGDFPNLSTLKELKYLDLSMNAKYDEIPADTVDLMPMFYLKYKSGGFSAKSMVLDGLTKLQYVNASGCNFTTSPVITNCPMLTVLALNDNTALGKIDKSIANLGSVKQLLLGNCGLTELPTDLSGLKMVKFFDLERNKLTVIPDSYGKLTTLESVDLSWNLFETLPDVFQDLTSVVNFVSAYGKLKEVPASVWGLKQVRTIYMQLNKLSGQIDVDFSQHVRLSELNLSFNELNGNLEWLSTMKVVVRVLLSWNKIVGPLPENIGDCKKMDTFAIDSNYVTGAIPASFSKLTNLTTCHMFGNCLEGQIPEVVLQMPEWCKLRSFITKQRKGYELLFVNHC